MGAAIIAVAACGPATTTPPPGVTPGPGTPTAAPPVTGPTQVTFNRFAEIAFDFHPVNAQSNQYSLFYLLFSQLVRLDMNDESLQTIIGDLADSWDVSPDATVFTFRLNPNATWHDGTPVTANDVAYTATWAAQNRGGHIGFQPAWFVIKGATEAETACTDAGGTDPAVCGGGEPYLEGIRIVDDHTIEFTLAAPNALFLRNLADAPSSVMPRHVLEGMTLEEINRSDFKTRTPVGSGPYKMVRVELGQFVEVEAYDGWFKPRANIDRIFYKDIPPEQALAQLETGELDIGLNAGAANLDRLQALPNLDVQIVSSPGIYTIRFNVETPEQRAQYGPTPNMQPGFPFHVKEIRQAFYYGVDRRGINDAIYGGANRILWNPPGFKEYPGLNEYPFDVDKARELIETARAAGVDVSQPIRFLCPNELADSARICPIIVQQIEDFGLSVELMAMDIDTWTNIVIDESQRDTYDITMSAGGSEGLHPSRSSIYYLCEPMTLFGTGYYNCEMQDLFAEALTKGDPAEQDRIYEQIARILNEEAPQVYLWQLSGVHPVNKRLQGVKIPAFERYATMNAHEWTVTE
jgi:peptide/nickel transport system substrate-binding protein